MISRSCKARERREGGKEGGEEGSEEGGNGGMVNSQGFFRWP